jgi:cell division septation protein DedD
VAWHWRARIEDLNVRWLFLLLLVLNAFYYVWHQQQVPMEAQKADPLAQYQAREQDIRLLSEAPDKAKRKAVEATAEAEQSVCLFLGNFEVRDTAETLRQRLAGLDVDSEIQEVDAVSGVDFWVYLPPLASRSASLRQLKELQARQIDSFVIAEGDLENGISLGIFPRYESAESVMDRLSAAGYEPSLRKLSRSQRSFWVRVEPGHERIIDDGLLASLAASFSELRHEMKPCQAVDIEPQFE